MTTFETTYPRYPFAPLVQLGISIAAWLTGPRTDKGVATKDGQFGDTADGIIAEAA